MDKLSAIVPKFLARFGVAVLMIADAIALTGALFLSLALRFDGVMILQAGEPTNVIEAYVLRHWVIFAIALVGYLGFFALFRLYRYAWRFASIEMIWGVVFANNLGLFLLVLLMKFSGALTGFPRSVFIIFWVLSILTVGGVRILLRLANMSRTDGWHALRLLKRDFRPKRVVIMGGGSDGARLLSALHEDVAEVYSVIGFLEGELGDPPGGW
ncbi:MAG TPA: hypothetical protein PLZ36_16015, partial [Armatimonadota bacterium]|nr:hypothetical protein [Armatimonadota bacterium]